MTKTHERSTKNDKTYFAWNDMKKRCTNPNHKNFKDYGGRGIAICDRWMKFENFLADMGDAPQGLSLDRYPNNDGNYEPDNCRWATRKQQANNRRQRTRSIEIAGQKKNLTEWGEYFGVTRSALSHFARKRKISLEQAILMRMKK